MHRISGPLVFRMLLMNELVFTAVCAEVCARRLEAMKAQMLADARELAEDRTGAEKQRLH